MMTLQHQATIKALRARARILLSQDKSENKTKQPPLAVRPVKGNVFAPVTELFIAGGGGAGRALPSALQEAASYGLNVDQIKVVCAASVGTLLGLAIVVGVRPERLTAMLDEMPTHRFQDWSFRKIFNFLTGWGFCSGKEIAGFARKLIQDNTGLEDPTFLELYEAGFTKEFRVITTNVSKNRPAVFSHLTTPHKRVSEIVSTSCGIPLLYSPHWIVNEDGELEVHTDGGITRNFPFGLGGVSTTPLEQQLGFTFVNKGNFYCLDNDNHEYVTNFWQYFKRLLSMLVFQDPLALPDGVKDRTAVISVNHNVLKFDATEQEQHHLDDAGTKSVQNLVQRIQRHSRQKEATQTHRGFLPSFDNRHAPKKGITQRSSLVYSARFALKQEEGCHERSVFGI